MLNFVESSLTKNLDKEAALKTFDIINNVNFTGSSETIVNSINGVLTKITPSLTNYVDYDA